MNIGVPPLTDWTPEQFSLRDHRALLIGGTGGIGREIARGFLRAGARIIVASSNADKVESAVEELSPEGSVAGLTVDVRDLSSLRGVIRTTIEKLGHVDTLLNAQGILRPKAAEAYDEGDWATVMDINLRGVFFACTEMGKHMLARGSGSIINIASLAAYRGWRNNALYGISKAAIVSMIESLATEWAPRGVRVNGITPGFFLTDLNRNAMSEERKALARERTPVGRFGELPELVGAAVFLASPSARFVTGATIRVEGGFLAAGI
ncbi:MAG: SDR family NAD(P)-dependent oxidoreductase [Burkholderiales bacterium]